MATKAFKITPEYAAKIEEAYETFKSYILIKAELLNEDMLVEIFFDNIDSYVSEGVDTDADSGCGYDELYGDEIYEAVRFNDQEDEDDEDDEDDDK